MRVLLLLSICSIRSFVIWSRICIRSLEAASPVARMLEVKLPIPDHTTLFRRLKGFGEILAESVFFLRP